jgi:hypothetical protein
MAASLTSSRSVDEIHNLLLCGACNKTINEPKILSCSHSFCKACVENLATQDKGNVDGEGKKLNCPTCRSTTTLKPDENVAGLPNHEFILKGQWHRKFLLAISILLDDLTMKILSFRSQTF